VNLGRGQPGGGGGGEVAKGDSRILPLWMFLGSGTRIDTQEVKMTR
jgi:hypothetical protein